MPCETRELSWYSWHASLRRGCAAPWRGFSLLVRSPSLWPAAVGPFAIGAVVTAGISLSVVGGVGWLWLWLRAWLRSRDASWFWEVPIASLALVVAICCVAAAWCVVQLVLCGPCFERLARRVEERCGIPPDEFRMRPWKERLGPAWEHVLICGSLSLFGLAFNCVPFLGALAAVAAAAVMAWLLAGRTLVSFPLGLRNRDDPEGLAWCERHFWHMQGLGLVTLCASLVPVLGGLVLTSAAVGAVLLFRELDASAGLLTPRGAHPLPRPRELERVQG